MLQVPRKAVSVAEVMMCSYVLYLERGLVGNSTFNTMISKVDPFHIR